MMEATIVENATPETPVYHDMIWNDATFTSSKNSGKESGFDHMADGFPNSNECYILFLPAKCNV